jgi:F-type H+-transporting ATPase subunit gamma
MTRLHDIEGHLKSLKEISEIMTSMKSMSLMETQKLSHFLSHQQNVVNNIRDAASDFLAHYPEFVTPFPAETSLLVLIGSERGFCGDFNQAIAHSCKQYIEQHDLPDPRILVVGSRLMAAMDDHPLIVEKMEGAAVGQEVDRLLPRLLHVLESIRQQYGTHTIAVFHHEHEKNDIKTTHVLPPFLDMTIPDVHGYPPMLNIDEAEFYRSLVDHYLFAVMHELFFTSLMAEHYRRVQHLQGAIDRLEEKFTRLGKKRNILRQEEITEEIEVIMLAGANID